MSKFSTFHFSQYSEFLKFHFNFSWLVLQSTVYAQNYQRARPLFKPDKRPKPDTKALPACQEPGVVSCQKVKIKNGLVKKLKQGQSVRLFKSIREPTFKVVTAVQQTSMIIIVIIQFLKRESNAQRRCGKNSMKFSFESISTGI